MNERPNVVKVIWPSGIRTYAYSDTDREEITEVVDPDA